MSPLNIKFLNYIDKSSIKVFESCKKCVYFLLVRYT